MKHYIENKVIIVTGASSGFGEAAVQILDEMGARLVLVSRRLEVLQSVGARLTAGNWIAVAADATKSEDWQRVVAETVKAFGRIDVLVNAAGGGVKIALIEDMSDADFQAVLDVNLLSAMKGARAVIPVMRQNGFGHILNVSSACAHFAWPTWAVYTAAKGALLGFTRCLQKEIESWGGKATCFVPGAARTNFCVNANIGSNCTPDYPTAEDFARTLVHCIDVPPCCVIDEVSIWGVEQVKDVLNPY